jgi:hypothetical protein
VADGENGLYQIHEARRPFDLVRLADRLVDATVWEMLPAFRALMPGLSSWS